MAVLCLVEEPADDGLAIAGAEGLSRGGRAAVVALAREWLAADPARRRSLLIVGMSPSPRPGEFLE